jgi:hypothetical protein
MHVKTGGRLNEFSWNLILGSNKYFSGRPIFGHNLATITGISHKYLCAFLQSEVTGWRISKFAEFLRMESQVGNSLNIHKDQESVNSRVGNPLRVIPWPFTKVKSQTMVTAPGFLLCCTYSSKVKQILLLHSRAVGNNVSVYGLIYGLKYFKLSTFKSFKYTYMWDLTVNG